MVENYKDVNSIELIISEIERCLSQKLFLAALTMALALPDSLGKLVYPKAKSEKRYSDWFDKNVRNAFGILYSESHASPKMSGTVCYKLRCKLLHEATNDIEEKTGIDEFVLSFADQDFFTGNISGTEYSWKQVDPKTGKVPKTDYLYVGCKELCLHIVEAAKNFMTNHPELDYPSLRINRKGGHFSKNWFVSE